MTRKLPARPIESYGWKTAESSPSIREEASPTVLKSKIIWKMAWQHLKNAPKMTVISIAGGCIGAMLIIAALVFHHSFEISGKRWMEAHFGAIDWEIKPVRPNTSFTPEENVQIADWLATSRLTVLPLVRTIGTAVKLDSDRKPEKAAAGTLILGFDFAAAKPFDDETQTLSGTPLTEDEAIVSAPVAAQLSLAPGDLFGVYAQSGELRLLKAKLIAEERGITGYRGSENASGAIFLRPETARSLTGLEEGRYHSMLVTTGLQADSPPHFPVPMPLFEVEEQKESAIAKVKSLQARYGITFLLASVAASCAGALLLLQVLLMLADMRKEQLGVLRALGMNKRQIRVIFGVEAALLNLFSVAAGTLLGSAIGYGLIGFFRRQLADTVLRYEGFSIPLLPHLPVNTVLITAGAIAAVQMAITVIASRALTKPSIVQTLRGEGAGPATGMRQTSAGRYLLLAVCAAISGFHLIQTFTPLGQDWLATMGVHVSAKSLSVLGFWLVGSVASVYVILQTLPLLQKAAAPLFGKIGVNQASVKLAFRYPLKKKSRAFLVSAIFSIVFMMLTTTAAISYQMLYTPEGSRVEDSVMGYPAYAAYSDDAQRDMLIRIAETDPQVYGLIRRTSEVSPYRLNLSAEGVLQEMSAFSVVAYDASFFLGSRLELIERSPRFASDEAAWNSLLQQENAVILDEKYRYEADLWSDIYGKSRLPQRPLRAGDKIVLSIYEKSPEPNTPNFGMAPKVIAQKEVEIAGFVKGKMRTEFYSLLVASPSFYETFRSEGFKWPNHPEKGYVFFDFDEGNAETTETILDTFALNRQDGLHIPFRQKTGELLSMRQTVLIFVAFMLLSVLIGLCGLAIVQYRAVHERAKQMAMLRCIGLGRKHIAQLFMLEGSAIGWIGLTNGLLFGSTGAYLLFGLVESQKAPMDPHIPFQYPFFPISLLFLGLLAVTLLLNAAPAAKSLRLTPGQAIREADL
ncbi:ABC transporter permease [Paenibacillus ginsengarvi]|uniref:ABC transporter permease n=1 Tax=Paenibacillus ginsengarvi TaxID=400777 RepID=A0A3B0CG68_9BACL|nr:FtsX-like permease family protein [Paenibacillus ginsengarvi]RKN84362.1 ABC transporter permease [Paenibacillus ginsengarvi]